MNCEFDVYHNWSKIYDWNSTYYSWTTNSWNIPITVVPWDTIRIELRLCAWALNNTGTWYATVKLKWSYLDPWFASLT